MGVQGLSVDVGNSIEEVITDAAKAIVSSTEELDLTSSDFNAATETVDLDSTEATTDIDISSIDMSSLTPEDLEALVGTMTQEEYDQFIEGMEGYYDNQLEYLEGLLHTDDQKGYEDVLAYLDQYVNLYMQGSIITEAQEKTYLDKLAEFGVTDITSAIALQSEYKAYVDQIDQAIMMTKNVRDSAKYDYLYFMSDYADYKMDETEDLKATLEADSNAVVYSDYVADANSLALGPIDPNAGYRVYSYQAYHEKHPEIDPMEYVMMLPEDAVVWDIEGYETLKTLAYVYEMNPEYAKVYSYLYSQDPERAKDYLKANEYEFNNLQGQIEAVAALDNLYGADEATIEAWLSNELGVSAEGLKDGVITFGEGVWHSGEAALTGIQELGAAIGLYNGEIYENRVMSPNEYKRMYILQALLSKEDKIKAGVLTETGENANPNSLIDFTKDYAGDCLSNNYEISQGIGNMLPSIAISMVNPMAGSVALGVSSGGNAYHTSMVQGNDYLTSLGYGIFTGTTEAATQRLLGGIPGLSDVQVTGLKTYLQSIAREGGQEMLQGVLDEVYQAAFMGKELPTTAEEWAEFAQNIGKQGVYGAITAGILQVPSLSVSRHRISNYNNYMNNHNISSQDQLAIIDNIRKSNPKLENATNEQIIVNHYQTIMETATIMSTYNLDLSTATEVYNLVNNYNMDTNEAVTEVKTIKDRAENHGATMLDGEYRTVTEKTIGNPPYTIKTDLTDEEIIRFYNDYLRQKSDPPISSLEEYPQYGVPSRAIDIEISDGNYSINWVENNGFETNEQGQQISSSAELKGGDHIDRYGAPNGYFFSQIDVVDGELITATYDQRSLPYSEGSQTRTEYVVNDGYVINGTTINEKINSLTPIEKNDIVDELEADGVEYTITTDGTIILPDVMSGSIAPAYGHQGGGGQYQLPIRINNLVNWGWVSKV